MARPKKEEIKETVEKIEEPVNVETIETTEPNENPDATVDQAAADSESTVDVEEAKEVLENTDLSFNTEELTKELAEENEKLLEPIAELAEVGENISKSEVMDKLNNGEEVSQEELLEEIKKVEEKKEQVEKIIRKTPKSNAEFTSWWNGMSIEPF